MVRQVDMDTKQLKFIVEAALLAAGRPLDLNEIRGLFGSEHPPEKEELKAALAELEADYGERGIQLQEVASGYRIQVRGSMMGWLGRLWEDRAPRYSRALMETLAIIAYRQPVTRGDVEDIRGVGVTTNIMRTLLERNWIRVVGFRDVPGRPAMYGTTKEFLDYFGLRKLDDLPPLSELKDMEAFSAQLDLPAGAELPEGHSPRVAAPGEVDHGELASVSSIHDARGGVIPAEASRGLAGDGHDESDETGPPSNVIPLKAR